MATDAEEPPRERLLTGKMIAVGSIEQLRGGRELRCVLTKSGATVAVYERGKEVNPRLKYQRKGVRDGDEIDEGEFTHVLSAYRINSAWHDGEYTCTVLTVECLRHGWEYQTLTFKDL